MKVGCLVGLHPFTLPEQPFSGQEIRIGVSVENNILLSKYQETINVEV